MYINRDEYLAARHLSIVSSVGVARDSRFYVA